MADARRKPGTFVVVLGMMDPNGDAIAQEEPQAEPGLAAPAPAEPRQEEFLLPPPTARKRKPKVALTKALVRSIRDHYRLVGGSYREVGERFGVSESSVWRIVADLRRKAV